MRKNAIWPPFRSFFPFLIVYSCIKLVLDTHKTILLGIVVGG